MTSPNATPAAATTRPEKSRAQPLMPEKDWEAKAGRTRSDSLARVRDGRRWLAGVGGGERRTRKPGTGRDNSLPGKRDGARIRCGSSEAPRAAAAGGVK